MKARKTPTGAALPKLGRYIKPGQPQTRMECERCGIDGDEVISASPDRVRKLCANPRWVCVDCGGRMVPSNVEDCEELAPHLLTRHPVYIEDQAAEAEADLAGVVVRAAPDDLCGCCGHARASHLDPGEWYCRKCQHVNGRCADGSREVFPAKPFSPEVERCNGLATMVRKNTKVRAGRECERRAPITAAPSDDGIPF